MPISASFRGRNSAIQFLRPHQPSSRPSKWTSHRGIHTGRRDRNDASDQPPPTEDLFDETNLASFAEELTALVDNSPNPSTNEDVRENGKTLFQRKSELPKSPLMDPAFITAQQKHAQPKALGQTSRLRRNPYAQALATPIRICQITRMPLPSFFLQGFKVAADPENEQPYFVPQGTLLKTLHGKRFLSQKGIQYSMMNDLEQVLKQDMDTNGETTVDEIDSDNGATKIEAEDGEDAKWKVNAKSPGMFGSNTYILARSSMLSDIHGASLLRLIPTRIGHSKHAQSYKKALYRSDMDRHVLYMVRRSVYYWLLNLHKIGKGYISPYDDFETAKKYGLKAGVFLWTKGKSDASPPEFATILTEPSQSRPRKIPVHNLEFLLGETMMRKLRDVTKDARKDVFDRPILGIKNRNMTVGLELRLWWLQCYLAKHNKMLE